MARSKQDSLFALPYVHPKGGKPYVRLNYFDERAGMWKSKERRVDTIEEAINAYEDLKHSIGAQPKDYDPEKITFDQLMAEFKKAKPKMPEWYLKPIEEHFGKRRLKTITYGDLQEFKEKREAVPHAVTGEPRKPSTINREMEVLREVVLYAIAHDWLAKNPFKKGPTLIPKSEEESRDRIPSPDEEAAILEWCSNLDDWIRRKCEAKGIGGAEFAELIGAEAIERIEADKGVKDADIRRTAEILGENPDAVWEIARGKRGHLRPILIGLKDTGLRKGALLSLTWANADLQEGSLKIPKGPRNKKRPPLIWMTDRLHAELTKLWQKSDKKPSTKIFGGIKDFKRSYERVCELAGVADLHIHDWKHGYVTDMAEAAVEERIAMRAAGHVNAETHWIYTNIDKRIAKGIADKLNKLHAEREKSKPAAETVTDGTGFVS
jgi:integrase